MKKFLQTALFIAAAIATAVATTGCSKKAETSATEQKATIRIAYPNWAEGVAMTYLVNDILTNDFGRKVELTMADPGLIFASLAEGSEDFMMDSWLPLTHKSYMEKYGDRIEKLGVTFNQARIGLVVPAYVTDIDSVEQLNAHADEFDGKIIGIGQGAGIMKCTNEALQAYGMDKMELIPSSGPAMTTALGEAIQKKEPIVVTGWTPHWMFARFQLKFLEDPKGVYGADEQVTKIARKGFSKDEPEVTAFLGRMIMDNATLADLMDTLREAETENAKITAMHDWVSQHKDLVDSWICQK